MIFKNNTILSALLFLMCLELFLSFVSSLQVSLHFFPFPSSFFFHSLPSFIPPPTSFFLQIPFLKKVFVKLNIKTECKYQKLPELATILAVLSYNHIAGITQINLNITSILKPVGPVLMSQPYPLHLHIQCKNLNHLHEI